MKVKQLLITGLGVLLFTACSGEKQKKSITEGGMQCGPGKCGASMANGSDILVKKKMNILNQMKEDDTRRDCVLKSTTTKALYACVRVEETGRLSTKSAADNTNSIPKKSVPTMKCETGKCGDSM